MIAHTSVLATCDIDEGTTVWHDRDSGLWRVLTRDPQGQTVTLTNPDVSGVNPVVHGEYLSWLEYAVIESGRLYEDDTLAEVVLTRLDSTERMTVATTQGPVWGPAMGDRLLAWVDERETRQVLHVFEIETGAALELPLEGEGWGAPAIADDTVAVLRGGEEPLLVTTRPWADSGPSEYLCAGRASGLRAAPSGFIWLEDDDGESRVMALDVSTASIPRMVTITDRRVTCVVMGSDRCWIAQVEAEDEDAIEILEVELAGGASRSVGGGFVGRVWLAHDGASLLAADSRGIWSRILD